MKYYFLVVAVSIIAACGGLSKKECSPEECVALCTHDKAYAIGKNGDKLPRVCPKEYEEQMIQGHRKGITEYCRPENGYKLGMAGRPYKKSCPKTFEAGFLKEYNAGISAFQLKELQAKQHEDAMKIQDEQQKLMDEQKKQAEEQRKQMDEQQNLLESQQPK